jgi:hypothetical protein
MRLKFLTTTASLAPDVPFQAGQIIEIDPASPMTQMWLERGEAVLVYDAEIAMLGAPMETASVGRAKPRGRR